MGEASCLHSVLRVAAILASSAGLWDDVMAWGQDPRHKAKGVMEQTRRLQVQKGVS